MSERRPPSSPSVVVRAWERWKVIAHAIGTFQARVLLSLFYFLIVPPFALIVKLKDPLALRRRNRAGGWIDRNENLIGDGGIRNREPVGREARPQRVGLTFQPPTRVVCRPGDVQLITRERESKVRRDG